MKHVARLEEWKQRIMECRGSGLSVKAWCAHNACSPSTYYRWERELFGRIRKADCEGTGLIVGSKNKSMNTKQELVEVAVVEETAAAMTEPMLRPVAIVRMGSMEVSLTNAVTPELMKHLKELLTYAQ